MAIRGGVIDTDTCVLPQVLARNTPDAAVVPLVAGHQLGDDRQNHEESSK
jgi:hypothetical protein